MIWKSLIRPAMILIPFALGAAFPQACVLYDPPYNSVQYVLMLMMFISCLRIELREQKPRREHWILLVANLVMGVGPYFLLRALLPDRPELAQAAFFIGITPTATAAPVVIAFLNGRVGFVLTGFTVSFVCISASLLFLLPMVTGSFTADFVGRVAVTLLQVIALPLGAALLIRLLFPSAKNLPGRLKTFTFLLWSFNLFVLAAVARQYFIRHPETPLWIAGAIAGISLALCACNFQIGKYLGPKKLRRECSQLLGQKNTSFTMYLALHYAGALIALGPISYILWHNAWNAWQMYQYDRHGMKRRGRAGGDGV